MESGVNNNNSDLIKKADELWKNDKYEQALKLYDQITKEDNNVLYHFSYAEKLFQQKDYSKCNQVLQNTFEILEEHYQQHPRYSDLKLKILYLSGMLQKEGFKDYKSASKSFEEAKKLATQDSIIKDIQKQLTDLQIVANQSTKIGNQLDNDDIRSQSTTDLQMDESIDQEKLKEAKQVYEMLNRMSKLVEKDSKWHIISMKWIETWQRYVHFDYLTPGEANHDSNQDNIRAHPGKINNSDILLQLSPKQYLLEKQTTKLWQNTQLKPNLKECDDYMLINQEIWDFLYERYGIENLNQEIIRFGIEVNEDTQESIVEIYLRQILIYPIPNHVLKFDLPKTILISRKESMVDLERKIQRVFNNRLYDLQERGILVAKMRLWKSLTNKVDEFKEYEKKHKNYTSAKIDAICINGREGDRIKLIEDLDLAEEDIVICELPKTASQFVFQPLVASPSQNQEEIQQQQQQQIQQDNQQNVAVVGPSITLNELIALDFNKVLASQSRRGICGLQNLGNTCFMNSGLQCLSNTIELTKYFCFNFYKQDINVKNPLGMGGKLAASYAELVKEIWMGSSGRTAPHELKKVVGKRVTKFSGFGQQDSCELINYVLDLMHEDLNRVRQKPYIELQDSNGRPDSEVSKEHWDAFLARNQSIIVDLMYGQLKSTVECLTCENISITFDPFLTIALPIARPFKLQIIYVPYDLYDEQNKSRKQCQVFSIKLNKNSTVQDLEDQVKQLTGKTDQDLLITNFKMRSGMLESFFRKDQSCQDIDQSNADTLAYEIKPPTVQQQNNAHYKLIEFVLMKSVKSGKSITGQHYNKCLPILEFLDVSMTILDVKKFILQKVKYIYPKDSPIFTSDQELNKAIVLHIADNLPFVQESRSYSKKAICEFCRDRHGMSDTCDIRLDNKSGNSEEHCNQITLRQVLERMEHRRQLVIGVIFRENTGAQMKLLDPDFDQSHLKDMQKQEKEQISLDACFKAFSREELLTGDDQWYCNKCKEQRDIHKKLELYKLPRILIIQLKRFQSKKSSQNKQGGFFALAYAQVCQQEKVGDFVDYPVESLDLRPYIQDKTSDEPILYDLYAISNHYGSLHGGHYTATCYNSLLGKWYEFNDSSVGTASHDDVVSSGAYLLFYRRREQ